MITNHFKNAILIFVMCFITSSAYSQKDKNYENYYVAEFLLDDNSIIKGYYNGEIYHSNSLGSLIISSNIDAFRYITLDTHKKELIKSKKVKKITLFDNDQAVKVREKIIVKTIDKNGTLSQRTSDEIEFLVYDGAIKLYSTNLTICESGACRYSHSNFFIKKPNDEYAILAVIPKGQISFKLASSIENITAAFRAVDDKCPAFNEYLNYFDNKILKEQDFEKKLQKEYWQMYKTAIKDHKEESKKGNAGHLRDLFGSRVQAKQAEIFLGIIKEYEKNCPK